jgi:hypothetical protein
MKQCSACKEIKPESEYFKTKNSRDGLHGQCKLCSKKGSIRRSHENRTCQVCGKLYHPYKARLGVSRFCSVTCKNIYCGRAYRERFPLVPGKHRELKPLADRLCKKIRERRPCEKCGELTRIKHHPDYSRPTDVVWLCNRHHALEHIAR